MLRYEEFKEKLVTGIKDYLPVKYKNFEVVVHTLNKINTSTEGICLIEKGKQIAASPVIYIDMMYAHYLKYESLAATMKLAAESIIEGFYYVPTPKFELSKENIVFVLINYEKNKSLLETVPHIQFLDLALVFRWIVSMDEKEISGGIITNEIAKAYEMDENDLFELAKINTRRILPPRFESLTPTINRLMENKVEHPNPEPPLYILTNNIGVEGAASILYKDILETLKIKLQDNLYVIPSSINEVMIVPQKFADIAEVKIMVKSANLTVVAENERLSDNVYLYDGKMTVI
jgi:hypothetical protein